MSALSKVQEDELDSVNVPTDIFSYTASGATTPTVTLKDDRALTTGGDITANKFVGFGIVPIGSVVGWHKSMPGVPALPDGWLECNGQVINDADSPMNGETLPDLNGGARFLRGGAVSGTLQDDSFQGHWHNTNYPYYRYNTAASPTYEVGAANINASTESHFVRAAIDDGVNGVPRTATETRPINMSVVWIMRVK